MGRYVIPEGVQLTPILFSDACRDLPTTRDIGFPHLIDMSDWNEWTDYTQFHVADSIATFLWNWDKDQFRLFFDLSRHDFKITWERPCGMDRCFTIQQIGRKVLTGFRLPKYFAKGDEWTPLVAFDIEGDGRWTDSYCYLGSSPANSKTWGRIVSWKILSNQLWDLERNRGATVKVDHGGLKLDA
ncbi:hypothetical protein LTR95_012027 [Oleoguttula sp. CCFEE 5521]